MKLINLSVITIIVLLFNVKEVSARARVPFGNVNKIEIVADLPDSSYFETQENSGEYYDLGRLHTEFNIAWFLSVWVTEEPKLVLTVKDSEEYYEISNEELDLILTEYKLDKDELLKLGFFTRYGGKGIILIILGLVIYGAISKKSDDDETEE